MEERPRRGRADGCGAAACGQSRGFACGECLVREHPAVRVCVLRGVGSAALGVVRRVRDKAMQRGIGRTESGQWHLGQRLPRPSTPHCSAPQPSDVQALRTSRVQCSVGQCANAAPQALSDSSTSARHATMHERPSSRIAPRQRQRQRQRPSSPASSAQLGRQPSPAAPPAAKPPLRRPAQQPSWVCGAAAQVPRDTRRLTQRAART